MSRVEQRVSESTVTLPLHIGKKIRCVGGWMHRRGRCVCRRNKTMSAELVVKKEREVGRDRFDLNEGYTAKDREKTVR